ncbi:MAG: hypothetical protein HNEKOMLI_00284 [Sodalis sp. Psp]|nr:hypothetical protein [Sodalis sp. Psp]MCR3756779.1 hypothetical protein [Sodalis sp. Ppy]
MTITAAGNFKLIIFTKSRLRTLTLIILLMAQQLVSQHVQQVVCDDGVTGALFSETDGAKMALHSGDTGVGVEYITLIFRSVLMPI